MLLVDFRFASIYTKIKWKQQQYFGSNRQQNATSSGDMIYRQQLPTKYTFIGTHRL